jgi:thiamine phosphate synthase YjbQ (UPF0047 family)
MDVDPNMISGLVTSFGIGGALVWYMYYTTSVTIPKLNEHNSSVLKEITSNFTESLKEEREFRRAETSDMKAMIREARCRMSDEQQRKAQG